MPEIFGSRIQVGYTSMSGSDLLDHDPNNAIKPVAMLHMTSKICSVWIVLP